MRRSHPLTRKTLRIPPEEELRLMSQPQLVALALELIALVRVQQAKIEHQHREKKRQAAPFGRKKKSAHPGKPGRKPGKGRFKNRQPPEPVHVTNHVNIPAPTQCPQCGSADVLFDHEEDAYTTDIPEPEPEVTHFHRAVSRCQACGCSDIRSEHPDVPLDQRGATAHRLGPRLFLAAHAMHYGRGVPVCKTAPIIKELTGIEVTPSALTQDALRRAERHPLSTAYQDLRDAVPKSPVAQTDDTGFAIGKTPAQLMVFTTPDTEEGPGVTCYQVRLQHRNEEVREVIPADYTGTMVTDRGRAYDAKEFDATKQQKCIFHVGRSIEEVLETKVGAARYIGEVLVQLLDEALHHWHRWHAGKRRGWEKDAKNIQQRISQHLAKRRVQDPDNQRLLDELGWHDDRGNLTRFLTDPSVPPTNNLSEQELRLAIQARKVSQCVKNDRGARALEAHSSLIRTEQRKDPSSLLDALRPIYFGAQPQAPPAAPNLPPIQP